MFILAHESQGLSLKRKVESLMYDSYGPILNILDVKLHFDKIHQICSIKQKDPKRIIKHLLVNIDQYQAFRELEYCHILE